MVIPTSYTKIQMRYLLVEDRIACTSQLKFIITFHFFSSFCSQQPIQHFQQVLTILNKNPMMCSFYSTLLYCTLLKKKIKSGYNPLALFTIYKCIMSCH